MDMERREVRSRDGEVQSLSETECAILAHLAANRIRAISRDELLARLWGLNASGIETRTVDMHVARLRSKLAAPGANEPKQFIVTVRGKGYMLGPGVCLTEMHRGGKSTGAGS